MSSFESTVTASDWIKGISLSVLASVIGGASKLAIRKSWLLEQQDLQQQQQPSHLLVVDECDPDQRRASIGDYNHQIVVEVMPPDGEASSTTPGGPTSPTSAQEALEPLPSPTRENQQQQSEELLLEFVARRQASPPSGSSLRQRLSLSISRDSSLGESSAASAALVDHGDHHSSGHPYGGDGGGASPDDRDGGMWPPSPSSSADSLSPGSFGSRRKSLPPRNALSGRRAMAWGLRAFGMVGMTFLNPLCGVLAMNYASPSILAPFSGLTLVWIILWAGPLLGEPPSATQVRAALMILLGEVVVAMYGDHTTDHGVTVSSVLDSYKEPLFVLYFVAVVLWMAQLAWWMRRGNPTLRRFAWGVSGGSITGLQNFLKDALTLLKASKRAAGSVHSGLVALFGALAAGTAFAGLALLTACMKRYDATYSAAMFVGSFVLSASLMSVIHYDTLAHLQTLTNLIMYPIGLLVLLGGVYVLVQESREGHRGSAMSSAASSEPASPRPSCHSSSSLRGQSMIVLDSERLVALDSERQQQGVLA